MNSAIKSLAAQVKKSFSQRFFLLVVIVFPLASLVILQAIFSPKSPSGLPLCVVDYDKTRLSLKITRQLGQMRALKVIHASNETNAASLVRAAKAYGVLVIPSGYEKSVLKGGDKKLSLKLNAQFLMLSSLLFKAVFEAAGELSAQTSAEILARHNIFLDPEPVRINSRTLFNPELDYSGFLLPALLFAVLHILIFSASSNALAQDYKSGDLYKKPRPLQAIMLRSYVNIAVFTLWGLVYYASAAPHLDNFAFVFLAIFLLVGAYWFLGMALILFFRSVRMGISAMAFISTPAFAFCGITFPLYAMPLAARIWGEMLPLTHFLKILIDQGVRTAPLEYSLGSAGILATFFAVFFAAFVGLLRLRIRYVKPYIR